MSETSVILSASARRVSIARLTLSNFRCYARQRLETGSAPVVLTGSNGAGKTTLLEAISLLAPGRGLRRARLDDLARRSAGGTASEWAVAARLRTPVGAVDLGTGRGPAPSASARDRRQVRIDGQPAKTQTALAEVLGMVWLTPEMDRLFLDSASARRRFLDRLVFGIDPAHAGRVSSYERAMGERSRLLRERDADPAWLAALEETMATHGVAVAAARREVAARLSHAAANAGPFPGAVIESVGLVESWLEDQPALAAEDRLRAALGQSRRVDAEAGGAGAGPHRSDMVVRHVATGRMAAECSTGEQKALLISIVLASARVQEEERGVLPLVLLDEVAAHLDARRRSALFEAVDDLGAQAWYAGTDRSLFDPLVGRAQFFSVEGAVAVPVDGDRSATRVQEANIR